MSNLETRRFSISYTADLLFCFNVSIIYPCPYTYIVDFCYTHIYICVLFFILPSTFRACMYRYFVLWRHTQFLFNCFSSVFLCACVCCSVTELT